MLVAIWAVGLLLRLAVVGKLSMRRWFSRLPFFSLYILAGCAQAGCNAYFIYVAHDMKAANHWYEITGYFSSIARVPMYIEGFWWFCCALPNFRTAGIALMSFCTVGGLAVDLWTSQAVYISDQFRILSALERWTGIGVAVALIVALGFFKVIGGMDESAKWHALILAGWSLSNALAWQQVGQKHYMVAGWLMVGGNAIALTLWLFLVAKPPIWKAPESKPYDEDRVQKAWGDFRRIK